MERAAGARDVRIDSVKGGLMILVIFGHLLELFMASSPLYLAIYSSIYVFHMPLFVITAGMFSKAWLEPRDYRSIVSRLLIPLAVCQIMYLLWAAARSKLLAASFLQPHWILWFLLSMILWKLILPLIVKGRYGIALTVLLALLAGYEPEIGYAFGLSRTIYFFPFFLLGFQYRDRILVSMASHRWAKGCLLLLILLAIGWWSFHGLAFRALYGSLGYDAAPVLGEAPLAGRALMLAISGFAALAAVSLLSVRWRLLAYLGQRSLAIFVLHGLLVMAIGKLHLHPMPVLLPGLLLLSVLIAMLTAFFDPLLTRFYENSTGILLRPLETTRP